jgi:hypothetical protein
MLSKFRCPSLVILVLVLGAVLCSFWPSLFNGFTLWDDNIYVAEKNDP